MDIPTCPRRWLPERGVGFILIDRPEGTVAFSHRGPDGRGQFLASRWDEPFALAAMGHLLDVLEAASHEFDPSNWRNRAKDAPWQHPRSRRRGRASSFSIR